MGRRSNSKFLGVSKIPLTGTSCQIKRYLDRPYFAQLRLVGKLSWMSPKYETEREAAIAYDRKVLELGLDKPLNILKRK